MVTDLVPGEDLLFGLQAAAFSSYLCMVGRERGGGLRDVVVVR